METKENHKGMIHSQDGQDVPGTVYTTFVWTTFVWTLNSSQTSFNTMQLY